MTQPPPNAALISAATAESSVVPARRPAASSWFASWEMVSVVCVISA